jgi:hypothetical protein
MLSKVISRGRFKEMFLLCITFIKPMNSIVILSQLYKLSLTKFHLICCLYEKIVPYGETFTKFKKGYLIVLVPLSNVLLGCQPKDSSGCFEDGM